MSFLSIEAAGPRPPYQQLSSQLLGMISRGELVDGDRIAPIRQLAGDLGIAPTTVARAYRELEQLGVLASAGRRGTIVTANTDSTAVHHHDTLTKLAHAVEAAVDAGVTPAEIVRKVEQGLARRRSPS